MVNNLVIHQEFIFGKNVSYIDSGTDEGAKERNFVQQGDFALYPVYHIPSKTEPSFMFKIKFHISGRCQVIKESLWVSEQLRFSYQGEGGLS